MRIKEEMVLASKTDGLLLNYFHFDGKLKKYLDLPFQHAKVIFLIRCRMFPTKVNFPGRWSDNLLCNVCGQLDTVAHLFGCDGYADIVDSEMSYQMFFTLELDLCKLKNAASKMMLIKERIEIILEL